jgi:hypothetical protein
MMKRIRFSKILIIVFLLTIFAIPRITQAQFPGLVPCGRTADDLLTPYDESKPCQFCHIFILFKNIIDFLLLPPRTLGGPPTGGGIVLSLAVLMVMIAGMYFIFSAGQSGNIETAKSILRGTAIALLIIYGSWLLVNLFFTVIGVANWTGLTSGWFQINCPVP